MKRIYIHVGLHKTGTTAIQCELLKNREKLIGQNFYYPMLGIPERSFGHHNIAWELSRDRRYRSSYGGVEALLNKIDSLDTENIIISSEDFESSLIYPDRMQYLIDRFSLKNIDLTLIVYLRNLKDYLISMYCELLKAGMGIEFNFFIRKVFGYGYFYYNEWEFNFDYTKILANLKRLGGVSTIIRNYNSLQQDDIVIDFLNTLEINSSEFRDQENVVKINQRPNLSRLLILFIRNRIGSLSNPALVW